MAKGDRSVVKEALEDAQRIQELAVEAAKKEIIEGMTPSIKKLVEKQMRKTFEDADRMRRAKDGSGETEFEEGKSSPKGEVEMDELEKESMMAMFPGISEVEEPEEELGQEAAFVPQMGQGLGQEAAPKMKAPMMATDCEDGEEEVEEMNIPYLGEAEESDEKEEEMDEDITVDEVALAKAYESIMKASAALTNEASVTSGFGDSYKKSVWATEDGKPSDSGLMDKEGGEKPWNEALPKDKKDYSVKEAIEKGLRENTELKKYVRYLEGKLNSSAQVIKTLKNEVHKVNLFNTKVLKVNEMLNKFGKGLTNEQKKVVLEKIDAASTIKEVKMVAEAFKAALSTWNRGKVVENARKPKANAQRVLKSGGADQKVLRESADKSESDQFYRTRQLAGLVE